MAKVIPIGGTTCPECGGSGILGHIDNEIEYEVLDCPTCDGKGWVFEEDPDLLNDAY